MTEKNDMTSGASVRVLDVLPEFGYRLPASDLEAARPQAVARLETYEAGPWSPEQDPSQNDGQIGLLVLDGLVMRGIKLGHVECAELLGRADVLRPWNEDCGFTVADLDVSWRVLERTRIAVLDQRFAMVAGRWPGIIDAVLDRTIYRSRCLAFHLAVTNLTRIDRRLLVTLWFLAERFGRMTPEGAVVPVRLTHQVLASLVGAQRPSVTTALGQLVDRGVVVRQDDGSWLLCGEPPGELRRLQAKARARQAGSAGGSRFVRERT